MGGSAHSARKVRYGFSCVISVVSAFHIDLLNLLMISSQTEKENNINDFGTLKSPIHQYHPRNLLGLKAKTHMEPILDLGPYDVENRPFLGENRPCCKNDTPKSVPDLPY